MAKLLDAISLGAIQLNADAIQLDGEVSRSRIQIAKTGSWPASNKRKGGFSITSKMLQDMVKNTEQEIPVDYNHLSVNPLLPDQSLAAGWMEKLELSDDNNKLFSLTRWTPKAAAHIRAGEFRYISPTFLTDFVDPATGDNKGSKLLSAALTNYPFLQGMQPVALSELHELGIVSLIKEDELSFSQKHSMVSAAIAEKFKTSTEYVYIVDIFDDNAVINRGGRYFQVSYSIASGGDVELGEEMKEVVTSYTALTLLPSSTIGAKPTMSNPNPNEPTLLTLQAELQRVTGLVTTMQTELNTTQTSLTAAQAANQTLQLELKKRDAKDKVAELIRQGKILPKQRESMEEIALSNSDWFDKFAAGLEVAVQLNTEHGASEHLVRSTGDEQLDSRIRAAKGDEVIALVSEMVAKYKKDNNVTYGEAMNAVGNANPELIERYREAFVVAGTPGQVQ